MAVPANHISDTAATPAPAHHTTAETTRPSQPAKIPTTLSPPAPRVAPAVGDGRHPVLAAAILERSGRAGRRRLYTDRDI